MHMFVNLKARIFCIYAAKLFSLHCSTLNFNLILFVGMKNEKVKGFCLSIMNFRHKKYDDIQNFEFPPFQLRGEYTS